NGVNDGLNDGVNDGFRVARRDGFLVDFPIDELEPVDARDHAEAFIEWLQGTELAGEWVARSLLEKLYTGMFAAEVLAPAGRRRGVWRTVAGRLGMGSAAPRSKLAANRVPKVRPLDDPVLRRPLQPGGNGGAEHVAGVEVAGKAQAQVIELKPREEPALVYC